MNQEIEWRGGGQWWSFNEYLKADNFLTNYILILLSLGLELYSPDAELSKQRSGKRKFSTFWILQSLFNIYKNR